MRHRESNVLKDQGDRDELRSLPLNALECVSRDVTDRVNVYSQAGIDGKWRAWPQVGHFIFGSVGPKWAILSLVALGAAGQFASSKLDGFASRTVEIVTQ